MLEILKKRGLVESTTLDLEQILQKPVKFYIGVDPTAASMHLGNLLGIVVVKWLQDAGHLPVLLAGGATGRIGDPSGKSHERPLLSEGELTKNVAGLKKQFNHLVKGEVLDNYDWFSKFGVLEFLREAGKHFRMGPMLAKESVKTRLESEEGMSYTEFSYQLLQGYDFYHLNKEHGVSLQIGGSDQWGNITAGIEYSRKRGGETLHGMTFPLLTRSDGKKFGKSEGGAVWLDPDMCSPYKFYQYLYSIPDSDVIKMMRMLTFLPLDEIAEYEKQLQSAPNKAQERLAVEVTRFVHGDAGLASAKKGTEAMKPGATGALTEEMLQSNLSDLPSIDLDRNSVVGKAFDEVIVASGLLKSKGEAVRLVKNGGAYLNNEKVIDAKASISAEDLIGGRFLVVASGKKKKLVIKVVQ